MFKKVEDDVLLGVSKVITRSSQETSSLLIDEDIVKEKANEKSKISKEDEETNAYTLEDLINITNENEDLIRNIIEKKDGIKSQKDKLLAKEDLDEESIDSLDSKTEASPTTELVNRDEYNEMKEELLSSLKDHISYLKDQIDTKDQQLQNKDELIRNFQVLMKSDKDRIHELEDGKMEKENVESDVEIEEKLVEDKVDDKFVDEVDNSEKEASKIDDEIKKRGFFNWFKK